MASLVVSSSPSLTSQCDACTGVLQKQNVPEKPDRESLQQFQAILSQAHQLVERCNQEKAQNLRDRVQRLYIDAYGKAQRVEIRYIFSQNPPDSLKNIRTALSEIYKIMYQASQDATDADTQFCLHILDEETSRFFPAYIENAKQNNQLHHCACELQAEIQARSAYAQLKCDLLNKSSDEEIKYLLKAKAQCKKTSIPRLYLGFSGGIMYEAMRILDSWPDKWALNGVKGSENNEVLSVLFLLSDLQCTSIQICKDTLDPLQAVHEISFLLDTLDTALQLRSQIAPILNDETFIQKTKTHLETPITAIMNYLKEKLKTQGAEHLLQRASRILTQLSENIPLLKTSKIDLTSETLLEDVETEMAHSSANQSLASERLDTAPNSYTLLLSPPTTPVFTSLPELDET
ncbi:MAG: hypothetical protein HY861_02930 [Chlamydiia bacterium]|nr:hypothetical protein [Chlamydiia bacterium]